MQLTITFDLKNKIEVAEQLHSLADILDPTTSIELKSEINVSEMKKKSNGKSKPVKEEQASFADFEEEKIVPDEEEESTEEESSDDEEVADEEVAPEPEKKTKGSMMDTKIIPAFQAYARHPKWKKTGKNGMEEARKILAKFKVTNVRKLPEAKYGEVMKALSI